MRGVIERYGVVAVSCIIFAAIQVGFQALILLSGGDLSTRLVVDDSFYYYETAWRFAESGAVTFDGVNATNGVQFLWFWLVAGLACVLGVMIIAHGSAQLGASEFTALKCRA